MSTTHRIPPGNVTFQQALVIEAFLGAIAFACLVLLLQSPKGFELSVAGTPPDYYSFFLVSIVGGLGAVCIFGCLSMLGIAGGTVSATGRQSDLAATLLIVSLIGFLIVIPMMLLPTTFVGALGVAIFEVILFATYWQLGGNSESSA